jgi:hypothetical protein
MRIVTRTLTVAALSIALSFTTAAHAVSLKVDIGQPVAGTVTPESGYNAFLHNSSSLITNMYMVDFGTGGGGSDEVSVTLTAPFYRGTGTSTALYPQVTGQAGFNDLLSGAALMNSTSQSIPLVLSDLKEGMYMIRTYHHSNYTSNSGAGLIDVYLTDSLVTSQLVHDDVPITVGTTPGSFTFRDTMFYGTSATLLFDAVGGTSGGNHSTINGFELTFIPPVPEPSSLLLLGLGALGMLRHTRRHRRRA